MKSAIYRIKEDLSNLEAVMDSFDEDMSEFDDHVRLDMKTFARASCEQAAYMSYYSQIGDELRAIAKDMDTRLKVARAKATRNFLQVATKTYTDKILTMMVEDDPIVQKLTKALGEVVERMDKSDSMVEGFRQRGFSLNNLSRNRAAEFHNEKIYIKDA
jgi:hypothetical protein